VDYADLMTPEFLSGEPREDSKSIYTDLRQIANAFKVALLTATQTNREGAKAMTAKATDVAEDFNKIRIADIVISINAHTDEVAAGEARLFFAAARNGESGFTLRIKQERGKMKFLTKILMRE
jgi:replicative DNA helicase